MTLTAAPVAPPEQASDAWRAWAPGLVATVLVIALYFQKLLLNPGLFWRDAFDGRLILWILEHGRRKLLAFDLWRYFESIQYYPYYKSLAFSDSLIGMAPIYTLWRGLAPEIVALNLTLITVLALAALAFDRQLRALRIGPFARVVAIVIGLSSFPIIAVMNHFQLFGMLFSPAILILAYRILVEGERGLWPELLALTGFGTAIAMYLPFMLAFVLLPLALVHWRRVLRLPGALTSRDIAAIVVFLLGFALLLYPYIRLQGGFPPIPLGELHTYAGRLGSFFVLTPPNFVYPNLGGANGDWERSYSPGAVGIACLAVAAALVFRALRGPLDADLAARKRLLIFAGLVFLLAWGLSLGPFVEVNGRFIPTPAGALQKWIPSLRVIRAPGRYSVFFPLFIALVFAVGMALPGIRRTVAALALVFCAFQIPRADLIAKEARIPRGDACLSLLTARDVAVVVPLVKGGHLEWIEARIEHMLLMLPYKARIFAGYGNRGTPELDALTHAERLFRSGELAIDAYRGELVRLGATHVVLIRGAIPAAEEARFAAFPAVDCASATVSLRRVAVAP